MHRYLAVHIQHPRISYAALFRLDRPHHRSRQLVTLREEQSEATVELYLLEERPGQKAKPEKLLHTFWLRGLPARSAGRTQITVEGSYDGRGKAEVAVLVAGEVRDRASLRVPRESKVARRLAAAAAVLLLLLGSFGVWRLLASGLGGSGGEEPRGSATVERPGSAAVEADNLDGANNAGAVSGGDQQSEGPSPSPGVDARPTVSDDPAGPEREPSDSGDAAGGGAMATAASPAGAEEESPVPPVEELPPKQEFVVYFAPDRTALSPEARARLDEVAAVLGETGGREVRIVGHTALFGTEEGRIEISRGRAENVYEYLIDGGWQPDGRPTLAWEASTDPVTLDRDRQELNRRVEIEVGTEEQAE